MADDPRLKIPDELTRPVDRSKFPSLAPKGDAAGTGKDKKGRGDGTMEQLVSIGVVGSNFALAVAATGLIGWGVQAWVLPKLAPWPLVVGLLLGVVVGALRFVQDARKLMK
ncbi:MAG: hypothetical protein QM783_13180 [Phycisphaerales bacterium]